MVRCCLNGALLESICTAVMILGERFGSGDGEREASMTRKTPYEPLPASVLFGDLLMFGKNVEREKNGLSNLASGDPRRVLAPRDAGGEKIKSRWGANAADEPT